MKCLVLDDEPLALDILREYIGKVPYLECAGAFRKPLEALDFLQKHGVDLIFLDISMPDLTGIQFLKSLSRPPQVIFTTAHGEHALESYEHDAVDYLLKPIEFDRFLRAVYKARRRFLGDEEKEAAEGREVLIKSGVKYHKVRVRDIQYIQGAGNYVIFSVKGKDILSLMTMQSVLETLPEGQFIRIHRSYIVNVRHIDVIEDDRIECAGRKIPIGDAFREPLMKAVRALKI